MSENIDEYVRMVKENATTNHIENKADNVDYY